MGRRFRDELCDKPGVTWTSLWPNKPGFGKYYKRRLNKALRRAWKDPHKRGVIGKISDVNWRGW